jgi:RNA polymerase sigma factor (sigma-70 family)
MQHRALASLMDFLRREMPPPGSDLVSDGELLGRFIATRDEPAFELLVRRHGPLVWGIARRMLRDQHAAEDVLQATFLALARLAKSLRKQPAVSAWLARVASRIAIKARTRVPPIPPPRVSDDDPADAAERSELRATLDEAIDRLPEKLRRTVVLCYLSGHTTEEVARLLNCPRGTVLSRLSAARDKLRGDLTRQGITVSTASLAATLTAETSPAALPGALVALALKAAGPTAALTPVVITLAQGAVAMSWSKLAVAAVGALSVGVIGIGLAGPGLDPQTAPPKVTPAVGANIANQSDVSIEKSVRNLEEEMPQQMKATAARRIELKMRIYGLEERIKNLKELTGDASLNIARQIHFSREFGGLLKEEDFAPEQIKAPLNVLSKGLNALANTHRDLYEAQEELKILEEMANLRLEALKRRHAALTQ